MSRLETEHRVAAVMRHQYGVITRTQARSAGLTDRQIDHRVAQGLWPRAYPSVYRLAAFDESWHGRLVAACLHAGGVASHRCAAALWGLEVYEEPPVEISVEKSRRSSHSTRLHQSTQWHLRDEVEIDGIATTGIGRTLLDCAGVMSLHRLERLCEVAIRKRFVTWDDLVDTLVAHSRQGRNGCGPMRLLLQRRLEDQTVPLSDFSRRIVQLLTDNGVPRPVVEYRIVDETRSLVLQTDLAWPELKKAWELDGMQFHSSRTALERDKRKRNRAKALGWNIQEILWSMYIDDQAALVAMAKHFLAT